MATSHFQYDELLEFFKTIDKSLSEPVVLCLIGSSATILMGQQERGTEDIDVWPQASKLNFEIIRKSVEEAGFFSIQGRIFQKKDSFRSFAPVLCKFLAGIHIREIGSAKIQASCGKVIF